jgi:cytochrome b
MAATPLRIAVWDWLIRGFHWGLVASFLVAWASTRGLPSTRWHEPAGYAVMALLALRLVWGLAGSHYARFAQFVRPAGAVLGYARLVLRGRAPRYIGHNPLGGWMVLALLATAAFTALTGWLFTTARFWGSDAMALAHEASAWALLVLACLHVVGVIVTSIQHREHLLGAMIHGRKALPRDGDVS